MTDPIFFSLTVGDREWYGWQDVTVRMSLTQMAWTYECGVTERWGGHNDLSPLKPGMVAGVGATGLGMICAGYIDLDDINYTANDHSVHFSGRSRCADLIDCDVLPPWEYRNIDLTALATRLAEPFGVPVQTETDVGEPFDRIAVQPGETAHAVLERCCRMRAVLLTTNWIGDVVLTRAGLGGQAPATLVRGGDGGNILSAKRTRNHSERYSQYLALGQRQGTDALSADDRSAPKALVTDPEITRYRPKVIVAEQQGDPASLQARAGWQATVAKARSLKIEVTVQGWSVDGVLWRPNTLVDLRDDWLRCDGRYLIEQVTLCRGSNSGTTAQLVLVPPDAYTPEPSGGDDDS
jgi:prophage tail gpP-like protein